MSLIGSLEDLNLGDILQIIYLSQKSGVLVIRTGEGEGRIVFRDGLVCGGTTKGGPGDLRALLLGAGLVAAESLDAVCEFCTAEGTDLEAELLKRELVGAEQIDAARRESVESAVHEMFRWETGEFSFDLQRDGDAEASDLRLARGINPQFLAMERVRLDDESGRAGELEEYDEPEDDPNEMSAEEMFGVMPDEPVDALVQATTERLPDDEFGSADEDFGDPGDLLEADLLEPSSAILDEDPVLAPMEACEPQPAANPHETTATLGEPVRPSPAFGIETRSAPIVAIDTDLVALEWVKKTLKGPIEQVHIFQRCDLGLNRIRQYLARAVTPMVLVSPDTPGDPSGGIRDAGEFVKRLKAQAPGMIVIWLCEQGGSAPPASDVVDGSLERPAARDFRSKAAAKTLEAMGRRLREDLGRLTGVEPSMSAQSSDAPADAAPLDRHTAPSQPDEITRAMGGTSSRGEILPLVIQFARESFSRVALFMVRDGFAMGIAQSGLDGCGGPDDHGMRRLSLDSEDCTWLREVLTSKRPRLAGPDDYGDYKLAAHLGDRAAEEAFVAPIESDGQIVALLYADNLPSGEPIADTSLVEEALRQAGLALDRAVQARTQEDDPFLP